jgi:glycosyltransferase involved in cell wall biosynthesis
VGSKAKTNKPVRALFLSSCVRGGGAGWSLYYLLKHLDRSLVEPLVVVPDAGIFAERFAALKLRVKVAPLLPERTAQQRFSTSTPIPSAASYALNLADSARFIGRLASIVGTEQCDLVYCNNMMVKPLGGLAAQLADVPCVFHARNLHERWGEILLYCQASARLPAVKCVIANSLATALPYRQAVPEKVRVVYNGIDLAEYDPDSVIRGSFRRSHGIENNEVLIGYTGNLIERKGLLYLIRAAAKVIPSHRHVTFVAVGRVPIGDPGSYFRQCQQLVDELGLQSRFVFAGFVSEVRPVVADLDILVLPSLQEPFGRSIIEAMALGTAVVASEVGGIPEIIRDNVDGRLVPPGDSDALAGAIASLIDDPQLRAKLGRAGRQRVCACFDVAKLSVDIQTILIELSGGRR